MAVALLADAHVGGPGGRGDDLADELERSTPARCELLLVLGDLFHVWVGDRRYESDEIGRLLAVLDGVRQRGVVTRYLEGNRDFFLDDSSYARHFDSVAREHAFVSAAACATSPCTATASTTATGATGSGGARRRTRCRAPRRAGSRARWRDGSSTAWTAVWPRPTSSTRYASPKR